MERAPDGIRRISAVTLLTADMRAAVSFYETMGLALLYGGRDAAFTSFRVGDGYRNLQLDAAFSRGEGV
jgi:catechol 2,3-dioxygenase-like lactoylglutathione lyase family enzyme